MTCSLVEDRFILRLAVNTISWRDRNGSSVDKALPDLEEAYSQAPQVRTPLPN
jgi:hypothetical protein